MPGTATFIHVRWVDMIANMQLIAVAAL